MVHIATKKELLIFIVKQVQNVTCKKKTKKQRNKTRQIKKKNPENYEIELECNKFVQLDVNYQ